MRERLHAQFGKQGASEWSALLNLAVREAIKKGTSLAELQGLVKANIRSGEYDQDGYCLVGGTNISRQGVDANHALSDVIFLAKYLQVPLSIRLRWVKGLVANQEGVLEWSL